MTLLAERWRRFWFTPSEPTNLAVGRILLCGYLLYFNWGLGGRAVATPFLRELWRPVSFYVWLGDWIPSPEQLSALALVWKVSLLLSCVGLATRWSLTTACLLGVYVVGWRQNYGKVVHAEHVSLVITGVLALSRCGDALSLDSLIRTRRGRIECRALISRQVRRGCIWMPFHFKEARANLLTNDAGDTITGTAEYKVCAVRIEASA